MYLNNNANCQLRLQYIHKWQLKTIKQTIEANMNPIEE